LGSGSVTVISFCSSRNGATALAAADASSLPPPAADVAALPLVFPGRAVVVPALSVVVAVAPVPFD